ncbi:MAG: MazG nucleotide pyrophosphohydrolase domain-containing protein [Candidatus Heimdallarchaeota archaeon]
MVQKTIQQFQTLMADLYLERDRKRGLERSLIWLQTEIGELMKAYLEGSRHGIREEVADVFAWLCSVSNLLDIDLEAAAWEKYPDQCPRCEENPCKCSFI